MIARRGTQSTAAILLGGTHVWRDDAFLARCARVLLPVANVPLVDYSVRWLTHAGADRLAVCLNQGLRAVQRYFAEHTPADLRTHFLVDHTPRGPGGCARDAAEVLPAEQYVVFDGSVVPRLNLTRLLAEHRASGAAATVVVQDSGGNGNGRRHGQPAGIYVLARDALRLIPLTGYHDIKEGLLARLRDEQAVMAYPADATTARIADLGSYMAAQAHVLESGCVPLRDPEAYRVGDAIWIHRDAEVAPSVRCVGPVMVGPGARIGADSVLIGPTVLGRECTVGARCLLLGSVLWDAASVGDAAVLKRCVVADGVVVEGTRILENSYCDADDFVVA